MENESKEEAREETVRIGGAWRKVSKRGVNYISGTLNNGKKFVIYVNDKKVAGSTQPDLFILMNKSSAEEMGLIYKGEKDEY